MLKPVSQHSPRIRKSRLSPGYHDAKALMAFDVAALYVRRHPNHDEANNQRAIDIALGIRLRK